MCVFTEQYLVIRRVGGLEAAPCQAPPRARVIRRVGGLEVTHKKSPMQAHVIRRVGGLEGVPQVVP